MRRNWTIAAVVSVGASLVWGCASQQPVNMAPPVSQPPMGYNNAPPAGYNPVGYNGAPQGGYNGGSQGGQGGVYQWQEVPVNQQVPVARATFDQGGYQIFATSGETIVVPFVNQNLYAMQFGRTNGQPYFVNAGSSPILYLPPGGFLENAAAQNARWYPIPNGYNYTRPMYVSLAPSWYDYTNMGWYPGMNYYGGMWGYSPYGGAWMPGFYVSIGGHRYNSYTSYHTYYSSNPGYIRNRVVYNNYSTPRGSSGSFGTGRTGSFNPNRSMPGGSTGSFNPGQRSIPSGTGSFNRGSGFPSSGSGSFNQGRSMTPPATSRPSGGSFSGGGVGGVTNTPRASGGSFSGGGSVMGGARPSGGSFSGGSMGGYRPSGGGSSMGGSRPSGGSFGGGGRRR